MRAKLSIALSALGILVWAVPNVGAAHFIARAHVQEIRQHGPLPLPVRFQVEKARGLLLRAWINGSGPYVFALDTGAGLNVISERVVGEARLTVRTVRPTMIGGLTAARNSSNREAVINQLALGDRSNALPTNKTALVVSFLPPDLDGILDPTEAYSPLGYSIDMPNQRIEAVDTTAGFVRNRQGNSDAAVVRWLRVGESNRPFVRLGDGRTALIDTGSAFGLAVNGRHAVIIGSREPRNSDGSDAIRDIAGGTINSRRVSHTTVSIGELVLRGVPTDILFGVEDDAPVILGRDALYPFKMTFDPQRRLIEFVAASDNQ
jgi:hypothetical protein